MAWRSKNIKPIFLDKRINSMQEIFSYVLKHSYHVAFAFHTILSTSFKNKKKIPNLLDSYVKSCYKTVLKRILHCTKGKNLNFVIVCLFIV